MGLILGIVIYAVLAANNPFFDDYVFVAGIPLVFAAFGGLFGEIMKKKYVTAEAEEKNQNKKQNSNKNTAVKSSDNNGFDLNQLPEEQQNQIKQFVAKNEKYQAAKTLSDSTGMDLKSAIDVINKLKV